MDISPGVLDWLLSGDPAIRWQTQRDLLAAPPAVYAAEREAVARSGWSAQLLARQDPGGTWGGGVYSPKWVSTTYTLLLLRQMGLLPGNEQALRGCAHFWKNGLNPRDGGINLAKTIPYSDTCVTAMLLALFCYFGYPDERVHDLVAHLLREQMPDGGWNCERVHGAQHGSFHTTLSVLEGLQEYRLAYPERGAETLPASQRAHEFLLVHRLVRSHRTGEVVDPAMLRMHFPPRWHYDFIRVLDYFQSIPAARDQRMADAINLLHQKQSPGETWPAYRPWPGRVFFEMEEVGKPSRWNTLRALRVLLWWENSLPLGE